MPKYMVLYHAPWHLSDEGARATPEEFEAGLNSWKEWAASCGDHLVDLGSPLVHGPRLSASGVAVPSGSLVSGYSIMQASDMSQIFTLLREHPFLRFNTACYIEVFEMRRLPNR